MKNRMIKKVLSIVLIAGLTASLFTGCGKKKDVEEETYDEAYEESYQEEGEYTDDEESSVPVSDTSNIIPEYDDSKVTPKPVSVDLYSNYAAIEHAKENDSMDYLEWLADYCVNIIEPQAVEKLLLIPAFKEAAEEGLISKYICLQLDYNDQNQYGAMTRISYYNKNGCVIGEDDEEDCYNVGYSLLVNTCVFDKGTEKDPKKLRELQDTMIHEMMHAFTFDYTRNLMAGIYRDGHVNALENGAPMWFSEGMAVTVQAGYNSGRMGILENMFLAEDDDRDEILNTLSSTESMWNAMDNIYANTTKEELKEEFGSEDARFTDLTNEENTYSYSYLGTMYVYNMAAEALGLETFDANGVVNMDSMLKGLDYILRQLHDGCSLDQIMAEISKDPSTGQSLYPDVASLEKSFLRSMDEPSMTFSQKLLYDLESRTTDVNYDLPGGSVLPGYYTCQQDFMDEKHHSAPEVFEVVVFPQKTDIDDYYAVSTVRPSSAALTGMLHVSYAGETLSEAEAAEKDILYIGDEIRFVNDNFGREYKSSEDWQRLDQDAVYETSSESSVALGDAKNASYESGFMAISPASEDDYIMLTLFNDSDHGNFAVIVTPDGYKAAKYTFEDVSYPGKNWSGVRFKMTNGSFIDYYEDEGMASDESGNLYNVQQISESEARDFIDFASN